MENKKFYLLYSDNSGLNGVPIYLEFRLWENIDEKKNLMEPVYNEMVWDCYYEYRKEKFPNKLYFIVKAPKISFDYYPAGSGVIVSKEFFDFLKKYTKDFSYVPLEVYSNKMKIITTKEYYFLKFNSYLINGFDYEKSEYEKNIANNTVMLMNNQPWIAKVKKLVLNKEIVNNYDIFCLHGWIFFNKPFISEKLLKEALSNKFYGVKYIMADKLVEWYNNKEYLSKGVVVE